MRKDIKEAKKHLQKARELMSKIKSPYRGMTKQQIIDEIRKTREKLWEEKLAAHSRRKTDISPIISVIRKSAGILGKNLLKGTAFENKARHEWSVNSLKRLN